MLIIVRKKDGPGINLHVGDHKIEIVVTEITNGRVSLGIEAGPEVKIRRQELDWQHQQQNMERIKK